MGKRNRKKDGQWVLNVKGEMGTRRGNWMGSFQSIFKPTDGDTQNRVKWLYRVEKMP